MVSYRIVKMTHMADTTRDHCCNQWWITHIRQSSGLRAF